MLPPRKVAVVIGSLRRDSLSKRFAEAFVTLAPELDFRLMTIGDQPHFDQDLEDTPPPQWIRLRQEVAAADAILFVTPEYNRSFPGVLKNAIDVGSRPYGQSVWRGKPGAVISVSPGAIGGFGANHHLRQCMVFLNVPMLSDEAYIGNALPLFDSSGKLINEGTSQFLRHYALAFSSWIELVLRDVASLSEADQRA